MKKWNAHKSRENVTNLTYPLPSSSLCPVLLHLNLLDHSEANSRNHVGKKNAFWFIQSLKTNLNIEKALCRSGESMKILWSQDMHSFGARTRYCDLAKTRASGLSLAQRRTELEAGKWTNPLQVFLLHQILYPAPRYLHTPTPTSRHTMGLPPLSPHSLCPQYLFSEHFRESWAPPAWKACPSKLEHCSTEAQICGSWRDRHGMNGNIQPSFTPCTEVLLLEYQVKNLKNPT